MKWIKAIIVGALASPVMFILLMLGIHVLGIAPFNQPPSAAFVQTLGLPTQPLAPIVHFAYGIFWSVVLVAVMRHQTSVLSGLILSVLLWLIFMGVYAPIIGWGVFGIGGPGHDLPADDPMWVGSPVKLIVIGLLAHLIYGALIGWLNRVWIDFGRAADTTPQASAQPG